MYLDAIIACSLDCFSKKKCIGDLFGQEAERTESLAVAMCSVAINKEDGSAGDGRLERAVSSAAEDKELY
mgnify:CR=1 FL=1